MKPTTQASYEAVVRAAVERIVRHLDEPLDLEQLARGAALSPFHFHRIFKGMVGETALELHRRLRLERAALRLSSGDASVTSVAFDAGYDTHEAFTRAFKASYGMSPSSYREPRPGPVSDCLPPRQIELTAPSGLHVLREGGFGTFVPVTHRGPVMQVEVRRREAQRLATVRHVGPYPSIGQAFARLGALAGPAGLFAQPNVEMIALYHDDPDTVAAAELRSDAGITVPPGVALPAGLVEAWIPAGRYACATHVGPYSLLGDVWSRLMGEWLPKSGQRLGEGTGFEIYRNDPMTVPPNELRTEIYLPLA